MNEVDWLNIPLPDFLSRFEEQGDGTAVYREFPLGEGAAQTLMIRLSWSMENSYEELLSEEDWARLERSGEVPVLREGQRTYERLDGLMLKDLPAVLDTLVMLEGELKVRKREEAERKAAERKNRERIRAKERRKLKKLGEWG